jgi:DNA-binding MarR family transcriptional regulator
MGHSCHQATTCYHAAVLDQLERIAVASVAITARALVETAGSELTFLGWRTLVVVGSSTEQPRLSDLADRLGTSRPSTSKLVRRLARRGLVEAVGDAKDRRGVRVGLTAAGLRLHHAVVDRRRRLFEESLAGAGLEEGRTGPESLALVAEGLARWL